MRITRMSLSSTNLPDSSIPVQFQYGRLRELPLFRTVRKTDKIKEKPAKEQRKSPENQWFSELLVEISGIEPLTS